MNDFRMGQFDIVPDSNEPNFQNMASGVLWVPDLDTWRISTASGVRELRTGHGIVQVYRSADAGAQTFTTTFTDVNYDNVHLIDEQYYAWNGSSLVTVKHPGIYRVTYSQSIGISTGTSRSSARTRAELDGISIPMSITHSYHRTSGGDQDSATASFFIEIANPGNQISVASQRTQGTSTLQYIVGSALSIERISPLRNPGSPGFGDGGD